MRRKILVAAAVALAGCAAMRDDKSATAQGFDPKNPKVFVVTNNAACPGRKAAIIVDQEPIYFFRQGGQPITIKWHLQTRGYSFVPQLRAADPMPLGKSPPGEINDCRAGGQNMTCTNQNQNYGTWKYTLRIVADDGCGNPEDLDPTIGND
jgi:hypothetical protein